MTLNKKPTFNDLSDFETEEKYKEGQKIEGVQCPFCTAECVIAWVSMPHSKENRTVKYASTRCRRCDKNWLTAEQMNDKLILLGHYS